MAHRHSCAVRPAGDHVIQIVVSVERQSLDSLEGRLQQALRPVVAGSTLRAFAGSQDAVPFKTGYLKSTGSVSTPGGLVGEYGYGAVYAPPVEFGRNGHPGRYFVAGPAEAEADAYFTQCAETLAQL
jgi:hypothetical protein